MRTTLNHTPLHNGRLVIRNHIHKQLDLTLTILRYNEILGRTINCRFMLRAVSYSRTKGLYDRLRSIIIHQVLQKHHVVQHLVRRMQRNRYLIEPTRPRISFTFRMSANKISQIIMINRLTGRRYLPYLGYNHNNKHRSSSTLLINIRNQVIKAKSTPSVANLNLDYQDSPDNANYDTSKIVNRTITKHSFTITISINTRIIDCPTISHT